MSTIRFRQLIASLLILSISLVIPALAQVTTADITGRVVDAQGNAVVGATVTVRNTGTGLSRTATTGDEGDYTITQLPPGVYEITVEASGFSRALQKDYELNVGTKPTLNFELKPGGVTETVEVTGDAPLIETTKSEIGGVVTPLEVQNLPLLNRTFAALSVIMPEARPVGNFDPTKTRVGNFAMNGGDGRQLDVNVDGGDNKDNVVGSLLQNFAYEGIQEFQVLQHRWTAEQGRAVGGVVNVITKSGTNDLHGSFFANFRDEKFRKKDFFEKQTDELNLAAGLEEVEKPDFSRQEIGGSIGGKIITDKLFYFGALERFRERQNNLVPTARFAQLQAIPGLDPVAEIPTPYDDWLLTAKVDHRMSDKQSMFYRFSFQDNSSPNDQIAVPANADPTGGNLNDNRLYSFVANHTYTLSPTKLNVFSFHYQDFNNAILGVTDTPNITFPTVTTGRNVNVPQATLEEKYQFRDDFSFQKGAHNIKVGGNYIYTKLDGFFFFGAQGYAITFFDDPLTIANNLNGKYPQGFQTPGAVRNITFSDGRGDHKQQIDQLAFYFQDDWKASQRLTLNLGLRWDANIGNLPDQSNNRTLLILDQLDHPLANALTDDKEKLSRTTPNWKEFQPRLGFAFDPNGDGRTVIRGGYGIFFDQLFQNLTLFSITQSNPELFQTILSLTNNDVGAGQLANFRFGVDPLPPIPAGTSLTELAVGGFGRINDPDASEPYVQKFSIGIQKSIGENYVLSSDYVHTLGLHESRVQVINPRIRHICDPAFPGSTPNSSDCVRGANSRLLDRAFVNAGFPANRIEQINMIGTTNRSLFDSWTTQLRGRVGRRTVFSVSYVLANSRAWGGQPVASYSGNGIAIDPRVQFNDEEFGPTRIDERHRVVFSGVFDMPWGVQLAPIMQYASSRPYSLNAGIDLDGDGQATVDRLCEGTDVRAVLQAIVNGQPIPAGARALGCRQLEVNSQRKGFIVDANGNIEERGGRYFNVDLRASKEVSVGERLRFKGYVDFYNLFNTENLSFASRLGLSPASSALFAQPVSLYGPGFGPPVGRPLTVQLGFRMDF
ncbi:MAG TPA: TonB-dependent receptor [Blastocatellia bacterium]|nr:TonB-dependent receptor [Blastocatellia bacterium]